MKEHPMRLLAVDSGFIPWVFVAILAALAVRSASIARSIAEEPGPLTEIIEVTVEPESLRPLLERSNKN